jgi:DNA modification methylase
MNNDCLVKKGDLWVCGKHRILCEDSTNIKNVQRLMDDKKADMIFTDPPYNLLDHKIETGINPDDMFNMYNTFTKDNTFLTFTGQHPTLLDFMNSIIKFGYKYVNEIIWNKVSSSSPFGKIVRQHENILIYKKGNIKYNHNKIDWDEWLENATERTLATLKRELVYWKAKSQGKEVTDKNWYKNNKVKSNATNGDTYYKHLSSKPLTSSFGKEEFTLSTIWTIIRDTAQNAPVDQKTKSLHITQKPVLLINRLNRLCSKEDDLVLDLFIGCGTTLVACLQTNRVCYGMEIDPVYVEMCLARYKKESGKEPVREDGVTITDLFEAQKLIIPQQKLFAHAQYY